MCFNHYCLSLVRFPVRPEMTDTNFDRDESEIVKQVQNFVKITQSVVSLRPFTHADNP